MEQNIIVPIYLIFDSAVVMTQQLKFRYQWILQVKLALKNWINYRIFYFFFLQGEKGGGVADFEYRNTSLIWLPFRP